MKKRQKAVILVSFAAAAFLIAKTNLIKEEKNIAEFKTQIEVKNIETKMKRSLASTSALAPQIINSENKVRVVLGAKNSNYTVVNSYNKEWKKIYKDTFFRMTKGAGVVSNFKIKKKRSVIQVKQNIGNLMEHIIVSYNKPDGKPFSFEALINSQTGQVVQTWNQTRYEHKEPFRVPASVFKQEE